MTSTKSRPNYAKRAKECGLQHVKILQIQRYLIEDWEKKIEMSTEKFNWDYVVKHLFKKEVYEMEKKQFDKVVKDFKR